MYKLPLIMFLALLSLSCIVGGTSESSSEESEEVQNESSSGLTYYDDGQSDPSDCGVTGHTFVINGESHTIIIPVACVPFDFNKGDPPPDTEYHRIDDPNLDQPMNMTHEEMAL